MTNLIIPFKIKPAQQMQLPQLRLLAVLLMMLFALPQFAYSADSRQAAVAQAIADNGEGGKVLGVREKITADGTIYFEVKILDEGKVVIYKIDKN